MGFFDKLARRAPADLRAQAGKVVPTAGIVAVLLNKPAESAFPATAMVPLPRWNRVLTVAGATTAGLALHELGLQEYEEADLLNVLR
jgi:hypothetical protein